MSEKLCGKDQTRISQMILDHMGDIHNTPLATHVWEYHDRYPKSLVFCAVEVVIPSPGVVTGILVYCKRNQDGYTVLRPRPLWV